MINVLLDNLPTEYKGYLINTWFQVGLQISLLQYEDSIGDYERAQLITDLLFRDEEGELRDHPVGEELQDCVSWFLNGWNHDRSVGGSDRRLVDYDIDQWRIYADFMAVYHIDLSTADLHWWEFCGLLWNLPFEPSSFNHVIDIRRKDIPEYLKGKDRQNFIDSKKTYALDDPEKAYSDEEKAKIDAYDAMIRGDAQGQIQE